MLDGATQQFLSLQQAAIVGIGVLHAKLGEVHLFLCLARGIETLEIRPCLVFLEVLQTFFSHDNLELRGVEACKEVCATEDEVLGAKGTGAVLFGVEAQVERAQVATTHECRVGDGYEHGGHIVTVYVVVLMERHRLQVLLVLEGFLADGHGTFLIVGAGIDFGINHIVGNLTDISVINQVFVRGRDKLAAYKSHLMHIGHNILLHAQFKRLGLYFF